MSFLFYHRRRIFGGEKSGHVPTITEKRPCFHQLLPPFVPPIFWFPLKVVEKSMPVDSMPVSHPPAVEYHSIRPFYLTCLLFHHSIWPVYTIMSFCVLWRIFSKRGKRNMHLQNIPSISCWYSQIAMELCFIWLMNEAYERQSQCIPKYIKRLWVGILKGCYINFDWLDVTGILDDVWRLKNSVEMSDDMKKQSKKQSTDGALKRKRRTKDNHFLFRLFIEDRHWGQYHLPFGACSRPTQP